jgi:hypothetical protein
MRNSRDCATLLYDNLQQTYLACPQFIFHNTIIYSSAKVEQGNLYSRERLYGRLLTLQLRSE